MRKSNNYFKFLEYATYGKDHDNTIDKGNGVLECKSYVSISDIEYRYNTTFGLENDWLTLKNILINEDTLYVYYLENENSILVGVYLLDNYRTQKELKYAITDACTEFLYDILLEKSELRETNNDIKGHIYVDTDAAKVAPLSEQQTSEESITDTIIADDIEVLRAKQVLKTKYGNSYSKHLYAITNPNWHHVSLATLANIDFDMLDVKRQIYFNLNKDFKKMCNDLRKCKRGRSFDARLCNFRAKLTSLNTYEKISLDMSKYLDRQISMMNVECGMWTSRVEIATGCHKSRKYNHHILK